MNVWDCLDYAEMGGLTLKMGSTIPGHQKRGEGWLSTACLILCFLTAGAMPQAPANMTTKLPTTVDCGLEL